MFRLLLSCLALACANALLIGSAPQTRVRPAFMMAKKGPGKTVSVVLDEDVTGLGFKGTVVAVKPAFAENVLVRQNKGKIATPEDMKRIAEEAEAAAAAEVDAKKRAEAARQTIQQKYAKNGMVVEVQVGKDGVPSESVGSAEVAAMLKSAAGVKVAPADIHMPVLSELGSAVAEITLHSAVGVSLKVEVIKSKITFS